MDTNKEYIQIMIESLRKKNEVLDRLIELNRQQKFMLQNPNLSPQEFEQNMQYKSEQVEQLNTLDEGFEQLFSNVREELDQNRELYADEIHQMQDNIRKITEKVNTIQTQEIRNKASVENKFTDIRRQVKGVRNSQRVVKQYYDNMMSHRNAGAVSVIDNKK